MTVNSGMRYQSSKLGLWRRLSSGGTGSRKRRRIRFLGKVGLHVGAEGAVPVDDLMAAPVEGDRSLVDVLIDGPVQAAAVRRALPARRGCDEAEIGGYELAAGLEDAGGFGDGRPEVRDIYPDDVADDGIDGGRGDSQRSGRGSDDGALAS